MKNARSLLLASTCLGFVAAPNSINATPVPGISSVSVGPNVIDKIVISDIGNNFQFGDLKTTGSSLTSLVNSVPTGAIEQIGSATGIPPNFGFVDLEMLNHGFAAVDAIALPLGFNAVAQAQIQNAVKQSGKGSADLKLTFTNDGEFNAIAVASAVAVNNAEANATIVIGIDQHETGLSSGSAVFENSSKIDLEMLGIYVDATAQATGARAEATGLIGIGINQDITAKAAHALLLNSSTLNVSVHSSAKKATAEPAKGKAILNTALRQSVAGDETHATMTNAGNVDLKADVSAIADEYLAAHGATATIEFGTGLKQDAHSIAGSAEAKFSNSGKFSVFTLAKADAIANAENGESGNAKASMSANFAIRQLASAFGDGHAEVDFSNMGNIVEQLLVSADGIAALAEGSNDSLLIQSAVAPGSGGAGVQLLNKDQLTMELQAFAKGIAGSAEATADAENAVEQTVLAELSDGTIALINDLNVDIVVNAESNSSGGKGVSIASLASAIKQKATAKTSLSIDLTNNQSMEIDVTALVKGASGTATASIEHGIIQTGTLTGIQGGAINLQNSGSISVAANAKFETGSAVNPQIIAKALAFNVIRQLGSNASIKLENKGTMAFKAEAAGDTLAVGKADVAAEVHGVYQGALASGNAAYFLNEGEVHLDATANVKAGVARALATAENGIIQIGFSPADIAALAANFNLMTLIADAEATGQIHGSADAAISVAVSQYVYSGFGQAVANLDNSGTIDVYSKAIARGGVQLTAVAEAPHTIFQRAEGTNALTLFFNSGMLDVDASAQAIATHALFEAGVDAKATAVQQILFGPAPSAHMINSGTLDVTAYGAITNANKANSKAFAQGVLQQFAGLSPANDSFKNFGEFSVVANANADVTQVGANQGSAIATAIGMQMSSPGGAPIINVDIENAGNIAVHAAATAYDIATAHAVGLSLAADKDGVLTALQGKIVNNGKLEVSAKADSNDSNFGGANAIGIRLKAEDVGISIVNLDQILAYAITHQGQSAQSYAIKVIDDSPSNSANQIFALFNAGVIQAKESGDGGVTFHRGMAIDVASAPGKNAINLLKGTIYGHIDVKFGDVINVINGFTTFDGIINPECMFPVNDGISSICGSSTLNLDNKGSFFLRNNVGSIAYSGPSYAFVKSFNVSADGAIIYELPGTSIGGPQSIGTYPQVFAQTANLAGKLLVIPNMSEANFDDHYEFQNVIDANVLTGTFSICDFTVPSAVFQLSCIYDGSNNVDLSIIRIQMMAVAGLDANGRSIGAALERAYAPGSGRTMPGVVASLLPLSAEAYSRALNQLSGAAYANYLQSFSSVGLRLNEMIDQASDGEALSLNVGPDRTLRFWGQQGVQGSDHAQSNMTMRGVDLSVGNGTTAGFTFGKSLSRMDDQGEGLARAEGAQVGAYAGFASGPFTMKAMAGFSRHDGELSRQVSFSPFGGSLQGNADVSMWTLGLHTTAPIKLGSSSTLTPYLNLDAIGARMDGFSEAGGSGAQLKILGGSQNQLSATAGLGWSGKLAGFATKAKLGYRHELGDTNATFRASFAGGPSFDIVSDERQRGSFLAGVSLGGKFGPANLHLNYDGELNGGRVEQRGGLNLAVPF